jgi:hypothetical protein
MMGSYRECVGHLTQDAIVFFLDREMRVLGNQRRDWRVIQAALSDMPDDSCLALLERFGVIERGSRHGRESFDSGDRAIRGMRDLARRGSQGRGTHDGRHLRA